MFVRAIARESRAMHMFRAAFCFRTTYASQCTAIYQARVLTERCHQGLLKNFYAFHVNSYAVTKFCLF